jgi:hypothetical protein
VIDGGEGPLGEGYLQASLGEHVESLRGGHLVHEVKADEQLILPGGQATYAV